MMDVRYLSIPLRAGDARVPLNMSEEDYALLLDTLNLWKSHIIKEPTLGEVVAAQRRAWTEKEEDSL